MGSRNVAAACARWAHLDHVPFRALVLMANISRDDAQPPVYFGGVALLAHVIGHTDQSGGLSPAARSAAQRALRILVQSGAVSRCDRQGNPLPEGIRTIARPGTRANYALQLGTHALAVPVDNSTTRETDVCEPVTPVGVERV